MSGRPVFVTGAAGFVGANLVRGLLARGDRVSAAVQPGTDLWRLHGIADDVRLVELDVRDADAVAAALRAHAPEVVFHLAAHGGSSWQVDARRILETGLLGTAAVLEGSADAGVHTVVHAGSSSEYGLKDHAPREDEPVEPNSPYAVAKAAATQLCRVAARARGIRALTLRLYSVYGPYEHPARLVPRLASFGLSGTLPPLAEPETARDFVFVDDVVGAFLVAAEPNASPPDAVYNVGTGRQTTLREIVELARRVLRVDEEPRWGSGEVRSWDTDVWVGNPALIRDALGWEPATDLESGFRRTVSWLDEPTLRSRYA